MGFLTPSEMPMSFTGQALLWGTCSNILNPPNQGQGLTNRIVGKPIRAIARLIYQIAIALLAPFGALYHLGMAIRIKEIAKTNNQEPPETFKEHLKAAKHDIIGTLTLGMPFCIKPEDAVYNYLSPSLVKSKPLTKEEILNNQFSQAFIVPQDFNYDNPCKTETENWNKQIADTFSQPSQSDFTSKDLTLKNVHQINADKMAQGLYRFDELMRRALWYRDVTTILPSGDDVNVHVLCFEASYIRAYGND